MRIWRLTRMFSSLNSPSPHLILHLRYVTPSRNGDLREYRSSSQEIITTRLVMIHTSQMGNCNPSCTPPDTTNVCNVMNDKYSIPGYCGPNEGSVRTTWCDTLGAKGEWKEDGQDKSKPCYFNSRNPGTLCPGTCIEDGAPTIAGNGGFCKRVGFTGDPGSCCLNDYVCNGENANCFSDSAGKNTCDPKYRDSTSPSCQEAIYSYCSGEGDSSSEWLQRWTKGKCAAALTRNLYNKYNSDHPSCIVPATRVPGSPCNTGNGNFVAEGYFWGQSLLQAVLEKYESQGYVLGAAPNEPGYHPFQEYLYENICCSFPALCAGGLRSACRNKTLDGISMNPSLANWCGCYLPPAAYDDIVTKYGVEIPCVASCNRSGSIPLIGSSAQPIRCDQNVCLIDDVAINLIKNTGTPNVNFTQLCGGCKPGECSCTVGASDVTLVNDVLSGANIDYRNMCGSLTCTQNNSSTYGPSTLSEPCSVDAFTTVKSQIAKDSARRREKQGWWILFAIILFLLLFGLLIYFLRPRTEE